MGWGNAQLISYWDSFHLTGLVPKGSGSIASESCRQMVKGSKGRGNGLLCVLKHVAIAMAESGNLCGRGLIGAAQMV